VNTVADNKINYTNRDYKQAMIARKLLNTIGRPSLRRFTKIVENNLVKNCPVTKPDVLAAKDILGSNLGSLRGKTV
jgi:NADPH-dependent 7-cyano-7-deazaguanine reductase QueF